MTILRALEKFSQVRLNNPELDKKGACCSKENQLLIVLNAYQFNLIWSTYGELKTQMQGVKNLQEYFDDLIII